MRFLFTTFEGGGHVPPPLAVSRALVARGHEVLFVSDEANRKAAQGLPFASWSRAPNRTGLGQGDDPLRDWRPQLPNAVVKAVCRGVMCGPAADYAADAMALIARFKPDVIVSNELLFGVFAAAEATGAPLALLTSNVWCFPTREDLPPFGPGFAPARSNFERRREAMARKMIFRWYDAGLADLNRARQGLGLAPLKHVLDQLAAADRILLGVSRAFDYDARTPPWPFVYVGPLGERPAWAMSQGADAALVKPGTSNVLVSFSTTHQGQEGTLRRVARALSGLDLHAIITLGPALKDVVLPRADNITVVERADHDVLVPLCDLTISHGGHGTVLRPLLHAKPVVVISTGRDQPENAQRIVHAGAGVRLSRFAGAASIRRAVRRVLTEPCFGASAEAFAARLRRDDVGPSLAVEALEALGVSAAGSSDAPRRAAG